MAQPGRHRDYSTGSGGMTDYWADPGDDVVASHAMTVAVRSESMLFQARRTGRLMVKPTLRVIHGSAGPCPPWLDFPPIVVALSPFGRSSTCRFRLSREDAIKAANMRRLQRIWDLWSVVLGEPPPVPNVTTWGVNAPAEDGLIKLVEAHACFRGIRRALAEDDNGENVVVYILKPPRFYEHVAHMVCVAQKRAVPEDLVYAVYARLDMPPDANTATVGVVTHADFVEADPVNPLLPQDYDSRYAERLW